MEGFISKNEVTHPTKVSADIKIRQLICLATQAATNITSFLNTKFSSQAPPWLRAACKIGSDSPGGHVSSLWAGLSTAAIFHWNFPTRSPGEAGREGNAAAVAEFTCRGREVLTFTFPFQTAFLPDKIFQSRYWIACAFCGLGSKRDPSRLFPRFAHAKEHPGVTFSDTVRNTYACLSLLVLKWEAIQNPRPNTHL